MRTKRIQVFVWLTIFTLLASTQPVQATLLRPEPGLTKQDFAVPRSLESLLKPDGTLDLSRDFSGSLDATGWQVSTAPGDEPRFTHSNPALYKGEAPQAAGDQYWDNQFRLGVYNKANPDSTYVSAIAVNGTEVYVCGSFDHAGDVSANRIAKWDSLTHRWSALGSGILGGVQAIAASGDDVYVGGNMSMAGGIRVYNIAHWNDATQIWSAMGVLSYPGGIPQVNAIAIAANGDVYVGGTFETAGGVTVNNVARWDGSSWHALGSGTGGASNYVIAIGINGEDVYIGGRFETAGGETCNNVARWNGSTWSCLGGGASGGATRVEAFTFSGSAVYIAGQFTEVTDPTNGTQAAGSVARWDGSTWDTLNGGLGATDAFALAVGPDGVYVGGLFSTLADGATQVNNLTRWDGGAWHDLGGTLFNIGGGVDDAVYALAYSAVENSIYVGGNLIKTARSYTANHIARWNIDDAEFYSLGNSVNSAVYALVRHGDDIYLGGAFSSAGGIPASRIARWNKTTQTWSALGSGVSGCTGMGCAPTVYALTTYNNALYVGGNFTAVGGLSTNNIARWDFADESWHTLGEGVFGCTGIHCASSVRAIYYTSAYGLLVGGKFLYAGDGGLLVNNIASWKDDTWAALGPGTNGAVYAIQAPYDLHVGGAFINLGGADGDYITRYDYYSSEWVDYPGGGLNGNVYVLFMPSSVIYAGGDFMVAGVFGVNRLAKYENDAWSGFGSGVDATVQAIAYDSIHLYVGGAFANAGGKPSAFFGRWGIINYNVYLPVTIR